jgi:hypothetical protein
MIEVIRNSCKLCRQNKYLGNSLNWQSDNKPVRLYLKSLKINFETKFRCHKIHYFKKNDLVAIVTCTIMYSFPLCLVLWIKAEIEIEGFSFFMMYFKMLSYLVAVGFLVTLSIFTSITFDFYHLDSGNFL